MSLTNLQLEERILAIEDTLNTIQTAISMLATKRQVKTLYTIDQTDTTSGIDETRALSIETSLNDMQTAVNKLATKRQLNSLMAVIRPELDTLSTDLETLQTIVSGLLV